MKWKAAGIFVTVGLWAGTEFALGGVFLYSCEKIMADFEIFEVDKIDRGKVFAKKNTNKKEQNSMVYRLGYDNPDEFDYGASKWLDGDRRKVRIIDSTPDDGIDIEPSSMAEGRCIEGTYLPTRVRIAGPKRKITDFYIAKGYLGDEKFKTAVEGLEPGVHQFFPVEFVWKDGSHAGNRFWFIPCNRLDSVDRKKTTKELGAIWRVYSEGEFVFSRSRIGGHHAWIDRKMPSTMGLLISNQLKQALEKAGVTGMHLIEYPETD